MTEPRCPRCASSLGARVNAGASALCEQCAPYSETEGKLRLTGSDESATPLTGAETILVERPATSAKTSGLEEASATVVTKAEEVSPKTASASVKAFLQREGQDPKPPPTRLKTGSTLVGSERGSLRIRSAALAARHFRIEGRGNEFFLHDFTGSSGTFLNGYRIRAVRLMSGDRITAGNATFSFSVR